MGGWSSERDPPDPAALRHERVEVDQEHLVRVVDLRVAEVDCDAALAVREDVHLHAAVGPPQPPGETPAQAGMRLQREPVQPRWVPAVTLTISMTSVPDAWRDYLYWTGSLDP